MIPTGVATMLDKKARKLDLSLDTMDAFSFGEGLPNLRELALRAGGGNAPTDFSGSKLERLFISGDGGKPSVGALRLPASLRELQIHNAKLAGFSIEGGAGLEILHLSHCALTTVELPRLPKLRVLGVEGNRLRSLPSLAIAPKLERLYADANALEAIPDTSKNAALQQVWFKKNKLAKVGSFAKNPKLKVIFLDENKLDSYEWLAGVAKGARVSLAKTGLKSLSDKQTLQAKWPGLNLTF